MDEQQRINNKFDSDTDAVLKQLIKVQLNCKDIRNKKCRKSNLDKHLSEILTKRALGWSLERITVFCSAKYGLTQLNRTTVMRRIQKFYEME